MARNSSSRRQQKKSILHNNLLSSVGNIFLHIMKLSVHSKYVLMLLIQCSFEFIVIEKTFLDSVTQNDLREVQTVKDSLRIPLAVLKAGETRAVNPDVEFYDTSVSFKLIQGNGPVYIHGQNLKDEVEVVDMEEDTDEEDEGEEEEDEGQPKKKLKLENNTDGKGAKNKKK
ncbi:unnamed protein product [Hermetia illucens]|uniref:Nucleoplasmin core domain-containing protein n=1 Tax=Hermetia illucens TaxID=343691 RepID=A0A7R8UP45_HERIL|nr:unnamed protein product [Hermetia illucens]